MLDEELTAAIREVRERVKARHPEGSLGLSGVHAPDLTPMVHARDAAEAKVAAIGTVNPRPPGLKNSMVQFFKRNIARALDWHVREQIEFNRASIACVHASMEALADTGRALAALAAHHQQLRDDMVKAYEKLRDDVFREMAGLYSEAQELKDIRLHWAQWRVGFEDRRDASEIHMLRTISELQGAFQHRVTLLEASFRELAKQQHTQFNTALEQNTLDVQKRLWRDLETIRGEYEKLIHHELKLIRQKASIAPTAAPMQGSPGPQVNIDWFRFADVFRGSEERIREHQKMYAGKFAGAADLLDVGCGRGEFLEVAQEAGIAARGIDQSDECVAICRSKGLKADRAELFEHLDSLADQSLGGVYCSQVVEHLPPERLPDLINLLAKKMTRGALLAIETPNPECLAIFATHFYLDPTHTRPVPPPLLRFYMEEAGFVNIEVVRLAPAVETMPSLAELPAAVRESFFGGLDYAIFGRRG
ncbi:MAG TPA: methyltransferase domain-containing protein [Bryobacteraceae bacterium]|nr:methyltransferase domain-containing protein [Bryobacteraceae bacterium]